MWWWFRWTSHCFYYHHIGTCFIWHPEQCNVGISQFALSKAHFNDMINVFVWSHVKNRYFTAVIIIWTIRMSNLNTQCILILPNCKLWFFWARSCCIMNDNAEKNTHSKFRATRFRGQCMENDINTTMFSHIKMHTLQYYSQTKAKIRKLISLITVSRFNIFIRREETMWLINQENTVIYNYFTWMNYFCDYWDDNGSTKPSI